MKKNLPILFTVLAFLLGGFFSDTLAQAPLSTGGSSMKDVVPGVLYIKLKANHGIDFDHISPSHTGNKELDALFARVGVTEINPFDPDAKKYNIARKNGIDRMYRINFSNERLSPREITPDFLSLDAIECISPRFLFSCSYIPNDAQISQQYALDNSHMRLYDAWGLSKGNANIVIADVDQGVNYNHEDIASHIFKVDNFFGYDVIGDQGTAQHPIPDNDPMPILDHNHGTMTSGCFGAVTDNGKGIAGSGFNCMIMAIRTADNSGKLPGAYEGMHFALTHGAKIINCSFGIQLNLPADKSYMDYIQTFIDEARDTGALVIASAGNDKMSLDNNTFIPANLNGVFTIGATDQNDLPAGNYTNFGKRVEAYAPGTGIYSTSFPGNTSYKSEDGTSFSCPLTSGVAGLIWAKNPSWTHKFVMRQIIETCDNVVKPSDRAHYWGRVNALSALTKSTVPGLVTSGFKVDGVTSGGLKYQNKIYSLDVSFKNLMGNGSGITAKLIPVPGSDPSLPAYTIQQASATLGTMNSWQEATGSFKFTRDTNDDAAGTQLLMAFAVSYGTSTVQAQKYFDTLFLRVDITGDDNFSTKGVTSVHSSILQLGNTFPNPVSTDGTISFELATREYAKLSLCDVLGRRVSILSNGISDSGNHQIHFDARSFENGVYLYKLETSDGAVMTKRMVVIH